MKTGTAATNAVAAASAEAELEVAAADVAKIESDKNSKLKSIGAEAAKNRMDADGKAANAIPF